MAQSDKSITELDVGTLTEGSLFPAADVNAATGHVSGRHSASVLGEGMCGQFQYQALTTGDKTIFGAINELNSIVAATPVTGTLEAGQTSITISDASITTDSLFDVYVDIDGVSYNSITIANGSVTLTFDAQSSNMRVAILVRENAGSQTNPNVMSTGYQYIELPLYDDDYPVIKARVKTLYTSIQAVYIGDIWDVSAFCLYTENGVPQFRYTTSDVATIASPKFNEFVDIEMDYAAGTLKYDGTTYGGVQKTQLHNTVKLFGLSGKCSIFAIEEMKIYKNNALYMNLIPRVDASGQGYLYDTIGHQSYSSVTSTPLVYSGG